MYTEQCTKNFHFFIRSNTGFQELTASAAVD